MEIKLSIKQEDIEQAIKDYVVSKGITTPVRDIKFQVARKPSFALSAEIEVSETPAEMVAAATTQPQSEPKDTAPAKAEKAEKPKAKPAAKPKADPTPEPEAKEPEPAQEEEDTPPFEPDAEKPSANDGEAPAKSAEKVTESKSLFG